MGFLRQGSNNIAGENALYLGIDIDKFFAAGVASLGLTRRTSESSPF